MIAVRTIKRKTIVPRGWCLRVRLSTGAWTLTRVPHVPTATFTYRDGDTVIGEVRAKSNDEAVTIALRAIGEYLGDRYDTSTAKDMVAGNKWMKQSFTSL